MSTVYPSLVLGIGERGRTRCARVAGKLLETRPDLKGLISFASITEDGWHDEDGVLGERLSEQTNKAVNINDRSRREWREYYCQQLEAAVLGNAVRIITLHCLGAESRARASRAGHTVQANVLEIYVVSAVEDSLSSAFLVPVLHTLREALVARNLFDMPLVASLILDLSIFDAAKAAEIYAALMDCNAALAALESSRAKGQKRHDTYPLDIVPIKRCFCLENRLQSESGAIFLDSSDVDSAVEEAVWGLLAASIREGPARKIYEEVFGPLAGGRLRSTEGIISVTPIGVHSVFLPIGGLAEFFALASVRELLVSVLEGPAAPDEAEARLGKALTKLRMGDLETAGRIGVALRERVNLAEPGSTLNPDIINFSTPSSTVQSILEREQDVARHHMPEYLKELKRKGKDLYQETVSGIRNAASEILADGGGSLHTAALVLKKGLEAVRKPLPPTEGLQESETDETPPRRGKGTEASERSRAISDLQAMVRNSPDIWSTSALAFVLVVVVLYSMLGTNLLQSLFGVTQPWQGTLGLAIAILLVAGLAIYQVYSQAQVQEEARHTVQLLREHSQATVDRWLRDFESGENGLRVRLAHALENQLDSLTVDSLCPWWESFKGRIDTRLRALESAPQGGMVRRSILTVSGKSLPDVFSIKNSWREVDVGFHEKSNATAARLVTGDPALEKESSELVAQLTEEYRLGFERLGIEGVWRELLHPLGMEVPLRALQEWSSPMLFHGRSAGETTSLLLVPDANAAIWEDSEIRRVLDDWSYRLASSGTGHEIISLRVFPSVPISQLDCVASFREKWASLSKEGREGMATTDDLGALPSI